MIFDDAIEQVLATKEKAITSIVKLGTVTSVSGGRAYVRHYGDSAASTKQYTYIDGYFPEVDDTVAMLPQGNTWIIIGKVMNTAPVEKYATKTYVDTVAAGLLPVEYKNKLEDSGHTLTLSGADLLAGANEDINLGSLAIQFAKVYSKEFYENGVRLRADGILVVSGGNTYSLLLSYASSTATLTPSSDDVFALGSSSKKFKEAWLGLFRGSWKSGQSTERQISWNSSNAIVPDTANSVDFGTGSLPFKNIFCGRILAAVAPNLTSPYLSWQTTSAFGPSQNNAVDIGTSSKQLNAVYTNKLYLNGTEFTPSGVTVSKLHTTYGTNNRDVELTANASGMFLLPNVNNLLQIGNASYKLTSIYFANWHNGTRYITFDSSHNILPDTTNTVSLGTSSKQYKNIYGQNVYVNGTAVTSDKRLKEDIKGLNEKHVTFFKCLRPVQYKFKNGSSGRKHTGFIAQEVEDALHEAGMTDKDMAVVVRDPDDNYYLRYEEIISVQTKVIQDLMAKVEDLEKRVSNLERVQGYEYHEKYMGKGENK